MNLDESTSPESMPDPMPEPTPEPTLPIHSIPDGPAHEIEPSSDTLTPLQAMRRRIFFRTVIVLTSLIVILGFAGFFFARHWTRQALRNSLPQLDGTISIAGLSAPVTIQRDAHGIPHIRASSVDDLIIAQGFVTAQDRLWQMDMLRRHAAGDLAQILGPSLVLHDRAQRILQVRSAANRALASLPPGQLHYVQLYAQGVNASIAVQLPHLPLEFRLLRYKPAPWTPRDSLLTGLAMFQDLTSSFPQKLNREALSAKLPPALTADLYPVGSLRDHPPTTTATQPGPPSAHLIQPQTRPTSTHDLLLAQKILAPILTCEGCISGSNNWVVSGDRTAAGKPILSSDMHLAHSVPGIWYEADLEAPTPTGDFHVTGVSLPGIPFIVVGHNDHVAWGFTNLGADVQDLYIEHTRGTGSSAEYETPGGIWQPILHQQEIIHVRNSPDIALDVPATRHGDAITPIISGIFPTEKRSIALRWTIYDPANLSPPFYDVDSATDGASLLAAFSSFGGPAQNLVYADDRGHIGYHAIGRVPIRGSLTVPAPISPIPADALDTTQSWVGYIPYNQLPQALDPPGGILATANARITPDLYPFPITLNWAAPYRNERIWKLLADKAAATHNRLTPADMLAIQTDVYSDLDHLLAQRFADAIDRATAPSLVKDRRLHHAADILRHWNGIVDANASAPAIVDATRDALWQLLLTPHLGRAAALYTWSEKPYAEEQLVLHTPARWLPLRFANWDDLLASAVRNGIVEAHAPIDLDRWEYGRVHPVDIEHPIFSQSPLLQNILGIPTGTGVQPQSGDATTIKQVGRTFGPSERFTADLADPDHSTLNLVLGQSGNPASPWFMDQWPAWYKGTTFPLPFARSAVDRATTHTLTLIPH